MKLNADSRKSSLDSPNILSVTLRLIVVATALFGAYIPYSKVGIAHFTTFHYIVVGGLLLIALVALIRLCIWGFKWVKDERVSELGLHIVRFAVILFAVSMGIFVMLSVDYTNQYHQTERSELMQQAQAGRIYIQNAVGDDVQFTNQYTGELSGKLSELMSDSSANQKRSVCLYLITDGGELRETDLGGRFTPVTEQPIIAAAADEHFTPSAPPELVLRVFGDGKVSYEEYTITSTGSGKTVFSALTPVYTMNGRPVGVLEICEMNTSSVSVFTFASLELLLKVLAFVCFFSFGFYGIMQLTDISLRPRNFDRSRKVLSCGREAVRPILFFVTLTAALPAMMLLCSSSLNKAVVIPSVPGVLDAAAPLLLYLLGIATGSYIVKKLRSKLTELPSNLALGITAVCNLVLIFILDVNAKSFAWFGRFNDWRYILPLIFVTGLCYGISYRTIAKFQGQSDILFGYDKYAYLCSCLGAVSGLILGAVLLDNSSDLAVRIIMVLLSIVTCIMSIILLEDLTTVAEDNTKYVDSLKSYRGAVLSACAIGIPLCCNWIYIPEFLGIKGYSVTSQVFCVIMPFIAFCFGNRMRLRSRKVQRTTIVIASVMAAASFVPMLFESTPLMAVASSLTASLAVMFYSSALYSSMRRSERSKFFALLVPLLFVGLILASMAVGQSYASVYLLFAAVAALLFGILFLFTGYPERSKPTIVSVPTAVDEQPAITDGSNSDNGEVPAIAAPVGGSWSYEPVSDSGSDSGDHSYSADSADGHSDADEAKNNDSYSGYGGYVPYEPYTYDSPADNSEPSVASPTEGDTQSPSDAALNDKDADSAPAEGEPFVAFDKPESAEPASETDKISSESGYLFNESEYSSVVIEDITSETDSTYKGTDDSAHAGDDDEDAPPVVLPDYDN